MVFDSESEVSNSKLLKDIILNTKKSLKIVIWFYSKLPIELRQNINDYDSSIIEAINDFKNNGPSTYRMHQIYGFALYQNPTVLGVFGYKSLPIWDIPSISNVLESNISSITNEFMKLKEHTAHYERLKALNIKKNVNSIDNWKVYHLMEEGLRNENNLLYCPTVSKILDSLNICACSLGYAYFSVLSANSSIEPHYGVTNTKLRIQIPLLNQSNISKCYITINNKEYQYKDGKAIIFDDSYLHSVRNDSNQDRVVLLIDIWHPDLSRYTIKELNDYFYNGYGTTDSQTANNKPDHFIPVEFSILSKSVDDVDNKKKNYDYLCKCLLIGGTGVGKTSLLLSYTTPNSFSNTFITTIGVDFKMKNIKIRDKIFKLQIWDPSGPERFRTITTSFFRGASIILILVDLSDTYNTTNFESVTDSWYQQIINNTVDVIIILIGTKCDLIQQRTISYDRILNYANQKKILYFETSSKDNINIQEAFITAVRMKYQQMRVLNQFEEKSIKTPTSTKKTSCIVG